MIIMFLKHR